MVKRTLDRRDFLKLMGVASGTSMLAGCNLDRTTEKLIPYLVPPEDGTLPGKATYVATSCTECPAGCGISARIRDARPVKVDGIESHPLNAGGLCVRGQASINRLYLPERIRGPLMQDGNGHLAPGTWNQVFARIVKAMGETGKENVFLSGRSDGSLSALVDEFCAALGVRRLPEYELYAYAAIREANRQLLGRAALPWYDISKSDFLLTVGADIVDTFQNPVAHALAVSGRRAAREGGEHFAWYHAEPHASLSGLQSDHRLAVAPGSEGYLLAYLLREVASRRIFTNRLLEDNIDAVPMVTGDDASAATGLPRETLESLARELSEAHHPLVIAGGVSTAGEQGIDVARLATLLHVATDAIGSTVDFTHAQDWSNVGSMADMDDFMKRLESDRVGVAFVVKTDPAATLPDAERFRKAIDHAEFIVGIGDTLTETMQQCDVVLPVSHALESWGDTEPRRGVTGVIQPAFEPLFDTRSDGDILLSLMSEAGHSAPAASYQAYVMARWNRELGAAGAQEMVTNGFVATGVSNDEPALGARPGRYTFDSTQVEGPVLMVTPSLRWYDGRSKALPLLSEIPDPITTVSWGGWVSVSPESGIADKDEVELSAGGWKTTLAARVQPGLGKGVFAVQRGVANPPTGWAASSGECGAWIGGVSVRKTGGRAALAVLSGSQTQQGRGIVPGDRPAHRAHPLEHEEPKEHGDISFNPKPHWKDYRWSMAIDLDRCVGCAACVAACYVENNVPITGEAEHVKGREMSWIRIEPYYEEDGSADFIPAMCQHCDQAPCESVCPVFATYTNEEGLNNQVYNRCVGTRYCSNNCPYKMRRFNWFPWDKRRESPMELMVNPDVSLRGKGIMEKCSFCVQRIRKARHDAKDRNPDNWKIEDGEVTPACAQACPGNAIVFGNILDENSQVAQWARSERAHRMLEELGTGPAVFYLRTKGSDHGA